MKSDLIIKILKAGALLSVIIASGVYIVGKLSHPAGTVGNDENVGSQPVNDPPVIADTVVIEKPESDPMQPRYVPVNEKTVLQNVRRQGKTYISRVVGTVKGAAYKKDWGIGVSTDFQYTYGVQSTAYITQNDGLTIVEERSFDQVIENVVVGNLVVGLDLPMNELALVFNLFDPSGETLETVSRLNDIRIPVPKLLLDWMRSKNMLPVSMDPDEIAKKMTMFAKGDGEELLVNKKVKITFVDGRGVTSIEPLKGTKLSQREIDIIKRTNYVMDHYVMPDRQVEVDESWVVNGDVFAGLMDPRMSGRIDGQVTIRRAPDFMPDSDSLNRILIIEKGDILFKSVRDGQSVSGALMNVTGKCIIPMEEDVVTSAVMSGSAEYHELSTDHLLFEARMSITPRFNISYQCEVKD